MAPPMVTNVARAALLPVLALLGAACGGDDDGAPRATTTTSSTVEATTSSSPATTTTVATGDGGPLPATAVAATSEGRLAVIDTATGDVVRVLDDRFGDLSTPPPEGGHSFVIQVALAPGGDVAFVEVCCEPAGGAISQYELDGGAADPTVTGYGPSVSPTGELAFGVYTFGLGFGTGPEPRRVERSGAHDASTFYELTTWLDADTVAYVVDPGDGTASSIARHDVGAPDLDDDVVLAEQEGDIVDLVTRGDGAIVFADAAGIAHVLDPASGAKLATFDLGGPVVDLAYDETGTWLLAVGEDGELRWFGGGESATIPGSYTAADW